MNSEAEQSSILIRRSRLVQWYNVALFTVSLNLVSKSGGATGIRN